MAEIGLYHAIERTLRASDKPLTSLDLYDAPEVRKFAEDAKDVSNKCGYLWRRGLLTRTISQEEGRAKFAYAWKRPNSAKHAPFDRHQQPRLRPERDLDVIEHKDGSVTVETQNFSITFRRK